MITALQTGFAVDVLTASWIVTATLLATAITGLATAPLCAGAHRRTVARIGLAAGLLGFVAAALVPSAGVAITGLLVGGVGVGCAVAAAGAALAAFRNPDRVAGFNGLANRGVITIVLAVIPLIGLAPLDVFGALALFCLIGLLAVGWLPVAPVIDPQAGAAVPEAMPVTIPETGVVQRVRARTASRTVTIAGFALLVTFALWAASEDSLWAMAGVMGGEQAGLTPEGLGLALSGATAGGLVGPVLLMIFDNWAAMLGDDRVDRAFAWPEYVDAGALLAFSTDAPTAPHEALPNMYIAATRRSALDDSFTPRNPHFALPLAQALGHATRDAAASVGDGATRGRLEAGLAADFAIVDADPFADGPASLLTARVVRTVVAGETRYDAGVL